VYQDLALINSVLTNAAPGVMTAVPIQ